MARRLNLYLDDSGERRPLRSRQSNGAGGFDYFAVGGLIVMDEDEAHVRKLHDDLVEKWNLRGPLHSSEIRSKRGNFSFLHNLAKPVHDEFLGDLNTLFERSPIFGVGCVIDRPGYIGYYSTQLQGIPWNLCKTAFSVVVERAAKFAISQGVKLHVFIERCNKTDDDLIRDYFAQLRSDGMPFNAGTSEKYCPLNHVQLADVLDGLTFKFKTSPMVQLADLILWPICMNGYKVNNRTYRELHEQRRLIDCHLPAEQISSLGIKYSCFKDVVRIP